MKGGAQAARTITSVAGRYAVEKSCAPFSYFFIKKRLPK
jgi:hypothetical protein